MWKERGNMGLKEGGQANGGKKDRSKSETVTFFILSHRGGDVC
jgi:hypothetical protein